MAPNEKPQDNRRAALVQHLLIGGLTLYVVVLGVATVDELFDLGIFPPELDRQIRVHIKNLESSDPLVRAEAEKQLVEIGHFAIKLLIKGMHKETLRAKCAELLTKIVDDLDLQSQCKNTINRLGDRNPRVRKKAAWELYEIGPYAITALIEGLSHVREDVRHQIRPILKEITGQDFESDANKWKAWYDANQASLAFGTDVARWKRWYRHNLDNI